MKLLLIIFILGSMVCNAQTTGTKKLGDSLTVPAVSITYKKYPYTDAISDTVFIKNNEWQKYSELHDYGINTLMTTKFGLVQVGRIYYIQIIFGKPRKDYLVPISKIQATKFSKEYSLQIGKWDKVPEKFYCLINSYYF